MRLKLDFNYSSNDENIPQNIKTYELPTKNTF